MPPRHASGPGSRPIVIAAGVVLGLAVAAPAADATALSGWSVAESAFFEETDVASRTITANGRIWQVSFDRPSHPVLRWRRLTDGAAGSRPLRIARPRGADLQSEALGGSDTQLFVAGERGFLTGDWCLERDEEDESICERSRGFDVQFSIRTGEVLRSAAPREGPFLVGGTRISYVVRPSSGRLQLRDAITRRLVRTLPARARNVEGAGRFLAWKDPDRDERQDVPPEEDVALGWTATHVRERTSGRVVYDLRQSALRRAIQPRGAVGVQGATLQPDGSLALSVDMDADRSFRPVVVDPAGRVRRVSERPMRKPNQYWSSIRGGRVLLKVETNGEGRCGPDAGWLTAVDGHVGNDLASLPHSAGYGLVQLPEFETPATMSWLEKRLDNDLPTRYRTRVAHDLRRLPLTRGQRPRC